MKAKHQRLVLALVALAAIVLVPVMLNRRYMNAGLDASVAQSNDAVPYLEQKAVSESE